jgi:hypothetical protein
LFCFERALNAELGRTETETGRKMGAEKRGPRVARRTRRGGEAEMGVAEGEARGLV